MSTDYEQFQVIGGRFTGFQLECWVCDEVLPWEDDGCLGLGEMVRLADGHWAEHPDGIASEGPAEPSAPVLVARIPLAQPSFTGVLAYLADGGEQR